MNYNLTERLTPQPSLTIPGALLRIVSPESGEIFTEGLVSTYDYPTPDQDGEYVSSVIARKY